MIDEVLAAKPYSRQIQFELVVLGNKTFYFNVHDSTVMYNCAFWLLMELYV